ncbi:LysR family transcriptional regulator [Lactiplantibacillus herbarum]|uniref:LysR family transcriptional regulator n=1 Tax=Lactiplantibacillus herbarum TaxID=1670446 RepID=UPI00064E9CDF|nr:LysR family transcriptional regulator [Lactiplantibacillus herbarum]
MLLDNYLLEELVTFAQTGTLAATAAKLNVTQPTITRGMQKLEADLGVQLFEHQPNRLVLTKTGVLAAKEATQLLEANRQAGNRIQNFDRTQRTGQISSVLPGPLMLLHHVQDTLSSITIRPTLLLEQNLLATLTNNEDLIVISNQEFDTPTITSKYLGTETLAVNLNQFMYQANQATISFKELTGLSFIVLDNIGPWRDVIQEGITDAKFFYQDQPDALAEITKQSKFPYFTSNLSVLDSQTVQRLHDDNRVQIPLTDQAAQMAVYASYLSSKKEQALPIIEQLVTNWP